jgi:hypothetical protein
MLVAGCIDS